jgi:hypothetical protein
MAVLTISFDWNDKKIRLPLFSYEKSGANRYKLEQIGLSSDTDYKLTENFIFPAEGAINFQLKLRFWQEANKSNLIKLIIDSYSSFVTSGVDIVQAGELFMKLVDVMFPKADKTDVITTQIRLDNIFKNSIPVQVRDESGDKEIILLRLAKRGSFFQKYDLDYGIRSARIGGYEIWRDAIKGADKDIDTKGYGRLEEILLNFSEHVRKQELTSQDKALYLAGAIKTWAPNVVSGYLENGEQKYFSESNYRSIQLGSNHMNYIKGTKWEFQKMPNTGCAPNNYACMDVDYFIKNSKRQSRRKSNGAKLIDEFFDLKIGDQTPIQVKREEYIKDFRVQYDARLKRVKPFHPIIYDFKDVDLRVIYKKKQYQVLKIRMSEIENGSKKESPRHFIDMIEVVDI